jgi:hypothetical protein
MSTEGNFDAVCASVGFPLGLIDDDTIVRYILPVCAAVFTEGDVVGEHKTVPAGQLREWFGDHDITDGRFFAGLTRLYRSPDRGPLEDLERSVAAVFARGVFGQGLLALGDLKPTVPPLYRIDGKDVVFGGNFGQGEYREHVGKRVNYVLEIEPGIRAMHVIDQLTRRRPFRYIFASEQPFACQFLANYLLLRTDPRMRERLLKRGFVTLAEGDLIESLDRFVRLDRSLGDSHGRVDVAVMAAARLPRLSKDRLRRILERVHFLLRPGGGLLIGYPVEPHEPGQLAREDLIDAIPRAGFPPSSSHVHVGQTNLANPRLPLYSFHLKP